MFKTPASFPSGDEDPSNQPWALRQRIEGVFSGETSAPAEKYPKTLILGSAKVLAQPDLPTGKPVGDKPREVSGQSLAAGRSYTLASKDHQARCSGRAHPRGLRTKQQKACLAEQRLLRQENESPAPVAQKRIYCGRNLQGSEEI